MDYEIGSMDGAYKGRLHVAWPFIGRKTLTKRQKEYNDVHGFYRARIAPWVNLGDGMGRSPMDYCSLI